MATYNWQLWDNFQQAAVSLELELRSKDGGCVYMVVPEEIRQKFYVICWTPLNKLQGVMRDHIEGSSLNTWQYRLLDLRQNHGDFHLEFGAKNNEDGGMYWFPNLRDSATKDEIIAAVKTMMDTEHFEQNRLMARLREDSE